MEGDEKAKATETPSIAPETDGWTCPQCGTENDGGPVHAAQSPDKSPASGEKARSRRQSGRDQIGDRQRGEHVRPRRRRFRSDVIKNGRYDGDSHGPVSLEHE